MSPRPPRRERLPDLAVPITELQLIRPDRPRERADAARNRQKVLAAAARLFEEHGVEAVTMDAVAASAGVGKGTLFRRFGDKAGLAVALLDERERRLQEAVLTGPAPLGPVVATSDEPPAGDTRAPEETEETLEQVRPPLTAAPEARLHAFVDAYLDYLLSHLALLRMSENASPGARYRVGAYRFWHRHIAVLLSAAATGPDDVRPDVDALAHALLATLSAEHVTGVIDELGADRMRASLHLLVAGLVGAEPAAWAAGPDPSDGRGASGGSA